MGDSPAPLRAGDPATVGSYRLRGVLGVGGMGTVYLAEAPDGRRVALKVINPSLHGDAMFRHRFAAEAEAASRVAGFCTARVLDVDLDGSVPHLVTEYVAGPSLHDYATANGPLAGQVEAVAVGVAAALTAIHAVGLVHADLSPRNVLLSPFGPKVIDFGVARLLGQVAESGPSSGPSFGTPGWLAPEQVRGWPPSQASDVYAWGLLVSWAGTGRMPVGEHGGGEPDLAGLDESLAGVVRRALHADPRDRPTARQVLLALVGQDDPAAARVAATVRTTAAAAKPPAKVVARGADGRTFAPGSAAIPSPPTQRFEVAGPVSGTRIDPTGAGWPVPLSPQPPQPAALLSRPPRRRSRRAGSGVVAGVGLVALLACLLGGLMLAENAGRGGSGAQQQKPPSPPSPSRSPSPSPKSSPVAAEGKLRFTLASFSCGAKQLGDWPLVRKPKGQFCLAELKVENTGDGTGRLWIGNQKLRDSGGTEYGPDEWSLLYYDRTRPLANDIAPGASVTGTLVFDVPAGLTFTELRVKSGLVGGDSSALRLR
ncbi:serine/threonine-protein kinase [Dactylosporangium sp. NPDC000555]|uniref:serine/threonine-protein kinase n=1 Tax=Dactylosporangium sp. NPDC000555 TaxID=3154260 RepID=UPI003327178A